jgi:hypothetical protein
MHVNKLLVGAGLTAVSLIGTGVALAQEDEPIVPKTTVGIYVDSKDGLTDTSINCFTEGDDGKFNTVDGDATLFMENRTPHKIWCVINIKRVGKVS